MVLLAFQHSATLLWSAEPLDLGPKQTFHTLEAESIAPGSRYEGLISKWISSMRVQGIIGNYYTKMLRELSPIPCAALNPEKAADELSSLTVENSLALFVVVLAFFAIAIIVYIAERAWTCFRAQNPAQKQEGDDPSVKGRDVKLTIGDIGNFSDSPGSITTPQMSSLDRVIQELSALREAQAQMHIETQKQLQSLVAEAQANKES